MKKIALCDVPVTGRPLFEMQTLFEVTQKAEKISISYITLLPGKRVPEGDGFSCHTGDEYSFFLEGEVYTETGEFAGISKAGDATLIPRGEKHWCENRTDKPCRIACVMVE